MTYTLEQFAADIRDALRADQGLAAKRKVSQLVSRSLNDPDFVATYLQDRPPNANPREVLYEDPELGFCICGHVYDSAANGSPHDHGSSWAIYGQAVGVTEMTVWRIVERGEAGKPTLVEPVRTYLMKPGDAHLYDVADVHSPRRAAPVKLIRIEGKNLDHVKRSNIKAAHSAAAS
jgi:predicted metal-dependent enzyme (double-stranded beta helix superfamily)